MSLDREFHAHGWRVTVYNTVDSTNAALKRLADAPQGTAILAWQQTQGRGRLGRSFLSPAGGLYLSVLLRPSVPPEQLLHLTAMAAVAVRRAIYDSCGLPVQIKWMNDLVCDGKKVCGILTELVGTAVIIGIGINVNTPVEAFSANLSDIAVSLKMLCGHDISTDALTQSLLLRLQELNSVLLTEKEAWLAEYAKNCVTVGKTVLVQRDGSRRKAFAEGIDDTGGLRLIYENGERAILRSGEATLRAENGYS